MVLSQRPLAKITFLAFKKLNFIFTHQDANEFVKIDDKSSQMF